MPLSCPISREAIISGRSRRSDGRGGHVPRRRGRMPRSGEHHGTLLKGRGEGDSHFGVFALASDAVASACALQARRTTPVNGLDLRARIAVHVGEVDAISGDYYGVAGNQTARLERSRTAARLSSRVSTAALAAPGAREPSRPPHPRPPPHPRLPASRRGLPGVAPADARSFPAALPADAHGPA